MSSNGNRSFLQNTSDKIRAVFQYWDRIRAGRPMPRRGDFDPLEIPKALPGIILIDVEGSDPDGHGIYRYRVVGSDEVRNRGHDPTGRLVREGYFGGTLENVLKDYDYIRENRTFLYQPLDFVTEDFRRIREQSILLPFSEDGITVSQILVYSHRDEEDTDHGPAGAEDFL